MTTLLSYDDLAARPDQPIPLDDGRIAIYAHPVLRAQRYRRRVIDVALKSERDAIELDAHNIRQRQKALRMRRRELRRMERAAKAFADRLSAELEALDAHEAAE